MSKTAKIVLPILLGLAFLAYLVFSSTTLDPVACEVCVEYGGRMDCRRASGRTEEEAIQTGMGNACSLITSGRDELIPCTQSEPVSVACGAN